MAEADRGEVEGKLFRAIEDDKIGMLGLVGGAAGHFQPMTAFWEEESRTLWFYTYRDAELCKAAAEGARAMFTFVDKDRKIWACLGGELHQHHDKQRIDKFWNAVVAAWYPNGRDDPNLTLLHLKAEDGEVWINEKGPLRFGLDMLKSNLGHTTPDPGRHEKIQLGGGEA
jgi:general stress protein 26